MEDLDNRYGIKNFKICLTKSHTKNNDKIWNRDNKLKNGNSLETQFWNDNIEVDTSTEFMQEVKRIWKEIEDK